jgi:hypothetical protein
MINSVGFDVRLLSVFEINSELFHNQALSILARVRSIARLAGTSHTNKEPIIDLPIPICSNIPMAKKSKPKMLNNNRDPNKLAHSIIDTILKRSETAKSLAPHKSTNPIKQASKNIKKQSK